MKKLLVVTLVFLSTSVVQALPIGNPADPELYSNCGMVTSFFDTDDCCWMPDFLEDFSWRVGFYGNYVYDRELKAGPNLNFGGNAVAFGGGGMRISSMATNSGMLLLNICDQFDIFGTFGVSRINVIANSVSLGLNIVGIQADLPFSPEMSYSVGGRAIVWNSGGFYVGFEGQYFYSTAAVNAVQGYGSGVATYLNKSRTAPYREWEAAVAASYLFCDNAYFCLSPYAALSFSGVDVKSARDAVVDGAPLSVPDLQEKKITGWAIGMTGMICDLVGVSVEGHFANQKALSVIGQMSF